MRCLSQQLRLSRLIGKCSNFSIENLVLHVSFLFGLLPKWSFSTQLPDWSLSLEMQFYAAFPALFVLLQRAGAMRMFVLFTPLCLLALLTIRPNFYEPSLLLFKLPVFLCGMMLFQATLEPQKSQRRILRCVALCLTLTQVPIYGKLFFGVVLIAGAFCFLTTQLPENTSLAKTQRRIFKILGCRLADFGSDISYSIYLFHGFFISFIGGWLFSQSSPAANINVYLKTAIFTSCVFFGTLLLALFVFHTIEKPGIRLGRKIVRRLENVKEEPTRSPQLETCSLPD